MLTLTNLVVEIIIAVYYVDIFSSDRWTFGLIKDRDECLIVSHFLHALRIKLDE